MSASSLQSHQFFSRNQLLFYRVNTLTKSGNAILASTCPSTIAATSQVKRLMTDPKELCCPISHALIEHPVVAGDGFTYERSCIESCLKSKKVSPMTGKPIETTVPFSANLVTFFELGKKIWRDKLENELLKLCLVCLPSCGASVLKTNIVVSWWWHVQVILFWCC